MHVFSQQDGGAEVAGPLAPERLRDALFEGRGAVIAASHREWLDLALFMDGAGGRALPAGGRVAILTGGGGSGVIAADLCAGIGLHVPSLSAETRARLAPLVPAIASTANPVDLTPEMFTERAHDRVPAVLDPGALTPSGLLALDAWTVEPTRSPP